MEMREGHFFSAATAWVSLWTSFFSSLTSSSILSTFAFIASSLGTSTTPVAAFLLLSRATYPFCGLYEVGKPEGPVDGTRILGRIRAIREASTPSERVKAGLDRVEAAPTTVL